VGIHSWSTKGGRQLAGMDVAAVTSPCLLSYLGCTALHTDGENHPAHPASDVCDA